MQVNERHAEMRAAQRHVSEEHIEFAIAWGHAILQPKGRTAFHVGRREAKRARLDGIAMPSRAQGVAVVMAPDGARVTVIRSENRHRIAMHGRAQKKRGNQ